MMRLGTVALCVGPFAELMVLLVPLTVSISPPGPTCTMPCRIEALSSTSFDVIVD